MKYKCICGNISFINYNNFRCGKRCGCGRIGANRISEEELKKEVESLGFIFISSTFEKNYCHVIKCLCSCGEEKVCQLKSLRSSKGCEKCRNRNLALNYDNVKLYFAKHGCELLEKEYKNARTKMKYKCSCGNLSSIVFDSFKNGNRCRKCGSKKTTNKQTFSQKEVEEYFYSHGCKLIDVYTKSTLPINYYCSCGILTKKSFSNFKKTGSKCTHYSSKNNLKKINNFNNGTKKKKFTQKEVEEYFISKKCELISQYKNSSTPNLYKCVCGNIGKTSLNNFKKGNRCQNCKIVKRSGQNNYQWIKDRNAKKEFDVFKRKCGQMVRRIFKLSNKKKDTKSTILLGYKPIDLQNHIKSFDNWESLKNKKWHLDHIFPIKAFFDYKIFDIKLINCLDNLQILLYNENISKGAKYNKQEFENWLKIKNINFESKLK